MRTRLVVVMVIVMVGMLLGIGPLHGSVSAQSSTWNSPGWYRVQPIVGRQNLLMGDGGFYGNLHRLQSALTQVGPSPATTGVQWVLVRYSIHVYSGTRWVHLDSVETRATIPAGSGRISVQGFDYSVPDSYTGSDYYYVDQTIHWYSGTTYLGGVRFIRNSAGSYVCQTVVQNDCSAVNSYIWLR